MVVAGEQGAAERRRQMSGTAGDGEKPAGIRASDAERDATVERLRAATGDGRLTLAEFDQRMDRATSARTRAELDRPRRSAAPGSKAVRSQARARRPFISARSRWWGASGSAVPGRAAGRRPSGGRSGDHGGTQAGTALGVAILGSILSSSYTAAMSAAAAAPARLSI